VICDDNMIIQDSVCVCQDGFRLNSLNKCVVIHNCENNEVWNECGSPCEATCDGNNEMCPTVCVPKCECSTGLVRNNFGKCVKKNECFEKCAENMIMKEGI